MLTIGQKKALTLATNGAMTFILAYAFMDRSANEYAAPSLANFMMGTAFLFLEVGTLLTMRHLTNQQTWADRVQEATNSVSLV